MAISEAALAGIIGAAGSVAGAGASAIATGNLNKKNRAWQEQQSTIQREWSEAQADKQNAWNYEMWLKEQEYNSPEFQVERMRAAGLNPLFYGLDGNSVGQAQAAAQPLGYDRASQYAIANPVGSAQDAAMKAAQVSSIYLDNELKRKEIGWYDKEHQQQFDFKDASIDEIRKRIEDFDSQINTRSVQNRLTEMNIGKAEAETAVEWAKYVCYGLDANLKEQLNPLLVRSQELENELADVRNQYELERILAELAETKAHTAALYAQAALDGARVQGVKLDNQIKVEEAKFAKSNAQSRANLLKWTSNQERYNLMHLQKTWKGKVDIDNYYAEHYEEAFRNSWSKSGIEWGLTEKLSNTLATFSMLGMALAF